MNHGESELGPEAKLAQLLAASGLTQLTAKQSRQFVLFLELLLKWNARLNLTSIRGTSGILSRHFLECIACARDLPADITTLLDFGSGAGFPGIPVAICRPEIAVTLAESKGKKGAFLQETLRSLGLTAEIHMGRAETLLVQFDCVTLRAVDRMEEAIESAARLVKPLGWLAVMTTRAELANVQGAIVTDFEWRAPISLPDSDDRIVALGQKPG